MKCILCRSRADSFFSGRHGEYFQCSHCRAAFLSPSDLPNSDEERSRYETHNNDVTDPGYQAFVMPLVNTITRSHPATHTGLDFGSGTGPVVTYLLERKGCSTDIYDPFFHNDSTVFSRVYDFIACCEVIEHFHDPAREFARLFQILKPRGQLFCMTHLLSDGVDFEKWYYKDDLTHVFFYHPRTIEYIVTTFGFTGHRIEDRLVVLTK